MSVRLPLTYLYNFLWNVLISLYFSSPLKKLKKSLFGIATFYTYIFMQIFWRFPVINETKTRAFWGVNKLRKKFFCIQDGIFLVYSTQMDTSLLAKLNVTKDVDVIWK